MTARRRTSGWLLFCFALFSFVLCSLRPSVLADASVPHCTLRGASGTSSSVASLAAAVTFSCGASTSHLLGSQWSKVLPGAPFSSSWLAARSLHTSSSSKFLASLTSLTSPSSQPLQTSSLVEFLTLSTSPGFPCRGSSAARGPSAARAASTLSAPCVAAVAVCVHGSLLWRYGLRRARGASCAGASAEPDCMPL